MNAIVGVSYLALQSDLNARQRNQIERVNRAAQSLLDIINDILDFSKIEAGKLMMESIEFSLDDVLDNLADMMDPKSEGKDLELLIDIATDVPTLLVGNPLRLGQVLVNLGNNAVKFTNSGQIKLSINLVESGAASVLLRFRLQDTGIGMSQRQIDNLFQSFNQADNSTTRRYGGTGLGLAITKTLVEMMDGQSCVDSSIGVGSTFVFDARLGVQSHSDGKGHLQVAALQHSRVLIVDDNASSRDILVNMLQKSAVQLETAVRGEIALELAVQADRSGKPFDLVLMDWHMPGMDAP